MEKKKLNRADVEVLIKVARAGRGRCGSYHQATWPRKPAAKFIAFCDRNGLAGPAFLVCGVHIGTIQAAIRHGEGWLIVPFKEESD